MLKKPKFDLTKLLEVHADGGKEDTGAKVEVAPNRDGEVALTGAYEREA